MMNINHLTKNDSKLSAIMEQATYWRRLEQLVKQKLPPNLSDYYQVVCVEQGVLIFYADNAMVASRLKMITPALLPVFAQLDKSIRQSQIRIKPQNPAKPKLKQIHLSTTARSALQQTAEQVSHHPDLAAALSRLGQQFQKYQK